MSTARRLIFVEELTWSDALVKSPPFTTTLGSFPLSEEVG
jgi:hypothetical protein